MAPDLETVATEKDIHRGHRDALAALFQARPFQVVSPDILEELVGRNFQQRISEARRQLHMNIENVPRRNAEGKRLTGAYRYRPEALGRDASDLVNAAPQCLPIFGDQPGAFQR